MTSLTPLYGASNFYSPQRGGLIINSSGQLLSGDDAACCCILYCSECAFPVVSYATGTPDTVTLDIGDGISDSCCECCDIFNGTQVLTPYNSCGWGIGGGTCGCYDLYYPASCPIASGLSVGLNYSSATNKCYWYCTFQIFEFGSDACGGCYSGGCSYSSLTTDPSVANIRETGPWTLTKYTGAGDQYPGFLEFWGYSAANPPPAGDIVCPFFCGPFSSSYVNPWNQNPLGAQPALPGCGGTAPDTITLTFNGPPPP